MTLKQSEVDFIINKLDKGKEYIEKKGLDTGLLILIKIAVELTA